MKTLTSAETARQDKLTAVRSPAPGQAVIITNAMLARLDAPVTAARRDLQAAKTAARAIPAKIPLSEHNPDMVKLDTETKLITHAIRMAACNTETILARALAALCEQLTATATRYPGTPLVLHYEVKEHPGTA
jgi:hypothetical protein